MPDLLAIFRGWSAHGPFPVTSPAVD